MLLRLHKAGFHAYLVGGCVRDSLLNHRVNDWDVATNARPNQVISLFAKVILTGVEHGTVTVLVNQKSIEVTTFRGDGQYSDGRHPNSVVFLDSLEKDLMRRDFTINAMGYDIIRQKLIDPFQGFYDLRKRVIRAVGDPYERFQEDGLRTIRAVRFACALNFDIHQATLHAIKDALSVFCKVAPERVREELLRILSTRYAFQGIELMRTTGLLKYVLPELLEGFESKQNQSSVYYHALRSLKHARSDPVLRLGVLLHNIGEAYNDHGSEPSRMFHKHQLTSVCVADQILRRLRFSNHERQRIRVLINEYTFHYEPQLTSDGALRHLICRVGPEYLEDLWELRRACAWGYGQGLHKNLAELRALKERVKRIMAERPALKINELAIKGQEVMQVLNCASGPQVGQALHFLFECVLVDPKINCHEKLINLLNKWKVHNFS